MVDAIVAATAKWISSQLVDEAEFLYGVEDQMLNLQNDLKCMQRYIQDAEETQLDKKENGQVTIFIETIRDIAFRAEDVIDTYILKVGSDSKFTKFACFACNNFEIHAVGKQIEKIQDDIKNATERIHIFKNPGGPSSSHDQSKPQRRAPESYAHVEEEHIVGLDDNIKNLVQRITSGMEEETEWVVSIVGQDLILCKTFAISIARFSHYSPSSSYAEKLDIALLIKDTGCVLGEVGSRGKAAMVDAIVAATAKWISSQLVDEAEFLYGVEDQMLNLQNDLKCMQRYIQDAEEIQLDKKRKWSSYYFYRDNSRYCFSCRGCHRHVYP
ncbi:hypothetical protein Nepgr_016020 [Nepenthes gracilis]|uniref:Disease resistance N-terminal domain-containing protein n=1 Tax=Nepenthes gracilis TaxID=150966 RepID=A0AAD3SNU6_NEPGR|nr:hypothetical protein Nepgr_016020 [Nepenthes gracilis]